jgi:UDP-N-acetylglucosamine:LPS N-acetylglucosamine transferase
VENLRVEFDPALTGVLFFSRGHGRGHAIPDLAIAEELRSLRQDFDLRFASYATGAETLSELGHSFVDLELPAANPVIETIVRCARVIGWLKPHLVIAHEEFPALPAAKIFGLPTIFLTDWFGQAEEFPMYLLAYADEIIFLDKPGIFEEPAHVKGKVYYTAPVLRPFSYGQADRSRARQELGLPHDAVVISVFPGSWTEQEGPIFDLVTAAFDSLSAPRKNLIWIAGSDYDLLSERAKTRSGIVIKKADWQIDRLFVASDLGITKANRKTAMELSALGIPSISLSHALNWPDDVRVAHIPTNIALDAKTVDSKSLAECIARILATGLRTEMDSPRLETKSNGRRLAAERLSFHIDRIRSREQQAFEASV